MVYPSKEVIQGDPPFLFLFIIVPDTLSRLFGKAEELKLICGFNVGRDVVEVSHLQLVDDTLLFYEA